MSKRPIKIATAQSRISPDVCENTREVRRLIQQARSEGAAIAHFPEGPMAGCSRARIKSWVRYDWDTLVDELHSTADLARELGLWVVMGSSHRLMPPHRPHNEHCPRGAVAPHRARLSPAKAREGTIYRRCSVRDPRSDGKTSF
jgi:predicted amidohydrolase